MTQTGAVQLESLTKNTFWPDHSEVGGVLLRPLRMFKGYDRAFGMANDPLGHAPHQRAEQNGAAVRYATVSLLSDRHFPCQACRVGIQFASCLRGIG